MQRAALGSQGIVRFEKEFDRRHWNNVLEVALTLP